MVGQETPKLHRHRIRSFAEAQVWPVGDSCAEPERGGHPRTGTHQRDRLGGLGAAMYDSASALAQREPGDAVEDVRTLGVDYGERSGRCKHWRPAARESTTETCPDTPVGGTATALQWAKRFERHEGDPELWLAALAREKNADTYRPVMHKLRAWAKALKEAETFDQVNLGRLVCSKVSLRRIPRIVDAYLDPQRPNWEAAKLYTGTVDAEGAVSPTLRGCVARRTREESKVINSRSQSRELRGGGGGAGSSSQAAAAAGDAAAAGGLPGSEGRGRKSGRARGVAAAPQT